MLLQDNDSCPPRTFSTSASHPTVRFVVSTLYLYLHRRRRCTTRPATLHMIRCNISLLVDLQPSVVSDLFLTWITVRGPRSTNTTNFPSLNSLSSVEKDDFTLYIHTFRRQPGGSPPQLRWILFLSLCLFFFLYFACVQALHCIGRNSQHAGRF